MYAGLSRVYQKKLGDYFVKRKHWKCLVLYDDTITAFVLRRADRTNELRIAAVEQRDAEGITDGMITNSRKASDLIGQLLGTVSEESGVEDNRVLLGIDTPPVLLTPNRLVEDRCLETPCDESSYGRIMQRIVRESTNSGQHFVETIPLEIQMGGRPVEDPFGISGQMIVESLRVSVSNQYREDFTRCLKRKGFRCERFFSGLHNLCSGFSAIAVKNERVLLVDLKYNSTDAILFCGDRPRAIRSYELGLNRIILDSLSAILRIDRGEAITLLKAYSECYQDPSAEMIEEGVLPEHPTGLKCWQIHEIITGQLRSFIHMKDGIASLLAGLPADPDTAPWRLILTGGGAEITGIDTWFEERLRIRTETNVGMSPRGYETIPATAYGMALSIARDAGATIADDISVLAPRNTDDHQPGRRILNFDRERWALTRKRA